MKLKIIIPVNTTEYNRLIENSVQPVLDSEISIDIEAISQGSPFIQSRLDLTMNAPHVVELARKAEKEGFDGIFVTDMDMCGVEAARQAVSIPVIGGFRASAFTAMMLAKRFSILTVANVEEMQSEHTRNFGISENLASVRPLNIIVPNLAEDDARQLILEHLYQEALKAIELDGANALIFGCTGFVRFAQPLAAMLEDKLGKKIPVLDPNCCAISYLALLVKNNLSQSQLTYPKVA